MFARCWGGIDTPTPPSPHYYYLLKSPLRNGARRGSEETGKRDGTGNRKNENYTW